MTAPQIIVGGFILCIFAYVLWCDISDRRAYRRAEREFYIDRARRHD
jgi:hypothetical protein